MECILGNIIEMLISSVSTCKISVKASVTLFVKPVYFENIGNFMKFDPLFNFLGPLQAEQQAAKVETNSKRSRVKVLTSFTEGSDYK